MPSPGAQISGMASHESCGWVGGRVWHLIDLPSRVTTLHPGGRARSCMRRFCRGLRPRAPCDQDQRAAVHLRVGDQGCGPMFPSTSPRPPHRGAGAPLISLNSSGTKPGPAPGPHRQCTTNRACARPLDSSAMQQRDRPTPPRNARQRSARRANHSHRPFCPQFGVRCSACAESVNGRRCWAQSGLIHGRP